MKNNELSVNQMLWLSMELSSKCPHCDRDITINPNNICYQMGFTMRDKDGNVTRKEPGGYMSVCPNCNKKINVAFFAELSKGDK